MADIDQCIEDLVLEYSRYRIDDHAHIEQIFSTFERERVFRVLGAMISGRNREKSSDAALFVQDCGSSIRKNEHHRFHKALFSSDAVRSLEDKLRSRDCFARANAFNVLGKIGCRRSLPLMIAAYHRHLQSDPLNVPNRYFEISWLQPRTPWKLFKLALQNKSWLTRWACIEIIS